MPAFEFISKQYPTLPGCYLMKDGNGKVLYVGKAKNLRRRLASYFQRKHRHKRIKQLVRSIQAVEVIIVRNETESLILETNLIKHYLPKFNRAKKSKKSGLAYIILTDEGIPRFLPYGKHRVNYELDEVPEASIAQRFGPYATHRFRDALIAFVRYHFQLRDCHPMPTQACLLFHMHKCSGICEGRISPEDYARDVSAAIAFLSLQHAQILHQIRQEMFACAENLQYERAQYLKEQIALLEIALENQVVERHLSHDEDFVFCGESHGLIAEVRQGMLKHLKIYPVDTGHLDYLKNYYSWQVPAKIYIAESEIRQALKHHLPASATIQKPSDTEAKALMTICQLNYDYRVSVMDFSI